MRAKLLLLSLFLLPVLAGPAAAQPGREDPEFVKKSPTLGASFPSLTVYTADGKEFHTSSLRGQYTVLAFGCLT